jgi:ribonuclease HI
MSVLLPPLSGGYPVIALVTVAGAHQTCGWALLVSDVTGAEILETGSGTLSAALNTALAEKVVLQATQRSALIRTWRPLLDRAIAAAGGEDYLDIPGNIRIDDEAYVAALEMATNASEERARRREASGFGKKSDVAPLVIAVDGSRSRNGEGAWAWIDEEGRFDANADRFPSILQAELAAISAALRGAPPRRALRILCDSRDALQNARHALAGHPPATGVTKAVARILTTIARDGAGRDVTLEWVKGHAGHPLNDRADRLAVHARRHAGLPEYRFIAENIAQLSVA